MTRHNRNERVVAFGLALSAVAMLAWTSPANASPWRYYHGTMCVLDVKSAGPIAYDAQWGVRNATSSTQTVVCPLLGTSDSRGVTSKIVLTAYDRHTSSNISCTAYNVKPDGTVVYSVTKSTSGYGSAPMELDFEWLFMQYTTVIKCSVPAIQNGLLSHVASYRADEDLP